jgi:N-acetylglucosaminyldiphosphoundecaprenol N-acetyl-beta-D-mannosaminyltransferase
VADHQPAAIAPERREVQVAGISVHDTTFAATVDWIVDRAARRAGGYVCTPNVDYVVRARRNPAFREAILGASLRVPDGMWIIYACRIAGDPLTETVTGRLLLPAVAQRAAEAGLSIALYGAGPGIASAAADRLRLDCPGLRVPAAITPPAALEIGSPADMEGVEKLVAERPSVVFVCLGAPKQEIWMQRHAAALDGAVLVGVGASLDILAGRFREAPPWMTRHGLEWAFRLAQEPRRLAHRYLVDDPWILIWAVRTRIARTFHRDGFRPRPPTAQ